MEQRIFKQIGCSGVSAVLVLCWSQSVSAGSSVVIVLGNPNGVPAIGDGFLVALALMLAAAALCFMKRSHPALRVICFVSMIITAGVVLDDGQRAIAGTDWPDVVVDEDDPVCFGSGFVRLETGVLPVDVRNKCRSTSLTVLRYENFDCPEQYVHGAGLPTASVGYVIGPGGEAASYYCGAPD